MYMGKNTVWEKTLTKQGRPIASPHIKKKTQILPKSQNTSASEERRRKTFGFFIFVLYNINVNQLAVG